MSVGNWRGYFFKAGNQPFKNHYIQFDSYKSTPNQRTEIKAYRDENTQDLIRVTSTGKKSKIEFTTIGNLDYLEKTEIQAYFVDNAQDWLQRKILLEYWNDEDNVYYTSSFYIPDIAFTVKRLDHNGNPIYNPLEIHLIEY